MQEAEEARAELEARGSGLTDATPVLRCRAAIKRLQVGAWLWHMGVQTGFCMALHRQDGHARAHCVRVFTRTTVQKSLFLRALGSAAFADKKMRAARLTACWTCSRVHRTEAAVANRLNAHSKLLQLQGDLKRLDVRTGVLQAQLHQAELRRGRGLAA